MDLFYYTLSAYQQVCSLEALACSICVFRKWIWLLLGSNQIKFFSIIYLLLYNIWTRTHHLSKERCTKLLNLEVDSEVVFQYLPSLELPTSSTGALLRDIRYLLKLDWMASFRHTYWERNTCADWLANFVFSFPIGHHRLCQCPTRLELLLFDDVIGVSIPCLCIL